MDQVPWHKDLPSRTSLAEGKPKPCHVCRAWGFEMQEDCTPCLDSNPYVLSSELHERNLRYKNEPNYGGNKVMDVRYTEPRPGPGFYCTSHYTEPPPDWKKEELFPTPMEAYGRKQNQSKEEDVLRPSAPRDKRRAGKKITISRF